MQNFKLDGRTIGIIILVIIAAVVLLPRLLGGNNDNTSNAPLDNQGQPTANPRDTTVVDDGIELGRVVMATNVDRDGCPTSTTSTFPAETDVVYVVAEDSDVTEGTEVFVRWYREGQVYEDADAIVADQDYENTCIAFTLERDEISTLESGSYEAEFIINGNPADTIAFEIR